MDSSCPNTSVLHITQQEQVVSPPVCTLRQCRLILSVLHRYLPAVGALVEEANRVRQDCGISYCVFEHHDTQSSPSPPWSCTEAPRQVCEGACEMWEWAPSHVGVSGGGVGGNHCLKLICVVIQGSMHLISDFTDVTRCICITKQHVEGQSTRTLCAGTCARGRAGALLGVMEHNPSRAL